ncbi:cyclic-di-GMP phosphodiesterase [compost metagenome]
MLVVAEGIEHAAQRDILKAQGYEVGQGYFFSVPLPAGALRQWLLACQGRVPPMSHESPLAALE